MAAHFGQNNRRKAGAGFTLVEVMMSMTILALVMGGMLGGYIQSNRRAEWSSMSLAAQSLASKYAEQTRAATWSQLTPGVYTHIDSMIIPGTGQQVAVTSTVTFTTISVNPGVMQIRVDCMWQFPLTGQNFENTVVTWRAARQ